MFVQQTIDSFYCKQILNFRFTDFFFHVTAYSCSSFVFLGHLRGLKPSGWEACLETQRFQVLAELNLILVIPWFNFSVATGLPPTSWDSQQLLLLLFCRFVHCLSLVLKRPDGEWLISMFVRIPGTATDLKKKTGSSNLLFSLPQN